MLKVALCRFEQDRKERTVGAVTLANLDCRNHVGLAADDGMDLQPVVLNLWCLAADESLTPILKQYDACRIVAV